MSKLLLIGCLITFSALTVLAGDKHNPSQIALSLGADENSYGVVWSTKSKNGDKNWVEVCGSETCFNFSAKSYKLKEGLLRLHHQYQHKAEMTNLLPQSQYKYRVANDKDQSGWVNFTTLRDGTDWSPKFAVYGDLGYENGQSISRIIQDGQNGVFDLVLHVGDFAYNLYANDGDTGDNWMNVMQPVSSIMPYMVCPGNHEWAYNFTDYKKRFNMPGTKTNHWYSFNVGPVHVVSISSEFYIFAFYGLENMQIKQQYEWLLDDLKVANENRDKQPWIFLTMHRPFYCVSSIWNCHIATHIMRDGWLDGDFALEKVMFENGVDMLFVGHMHSYQRFYPVYKHKLYKGSEDEPFTNPGAPIQIISGSAGCREGIDAINPDRTTPLAPFWSRDYGYGKMQVFNSSHLYWEQVSDDQGGAVIDSMWVIKDSHGPYTERV